MTRLAWSTYAAVYGLTLGVGSGVGTVLTWLQPGPNATLPVKVALIVLTAVLFSLGAVGFVWMRREQRR